MKNVTILVNFFDNNGPYFPFVWILAQQLFLYIDNFSKHQHNSVWKIDKGLTEWSLVILWMTIKKKLNKNENGTNIIKKNTKNSWNSPNGPLCTLGWLFYYQQKNLSKHIQQNKDDFLLKKFRLINK